MFEGPKVFGETVIVKEQLSYEPLFTVEGVITNCPLAPNAKVTFCAIATGNT